MELGKILIGIVVMVLVSGGMVLVISDGLQQYPDIIGSGNYTSLQRIQSSQYQLENITRETQSKLQNISQNQGGGIIGAIQDYVGLFFSAGYQAASFAITGISLLNIVSEEAVTNVAGDTAFGSLLKTGLWMIVIIIGITILIKYITKVD